MPVQFEDRAYILHKRAYKESSYIIDLFTFESGVVSVIAKGAKSNKSKFYLNLQLFNQLDVMYSGKTELMTLIQADVNKTVSFSVKKNTFCGYYINELILRLLHKHDQHQNLFSHYEQLLNDMANAIQPEALLRAFEKALLIEIGYGIDFGNTANGVDIQDKELYLVSPDNGIMHSSSNQSSDLLVTGKTLKDIELEDFSDLNTLRESKQLMRRILQHHLGGRPLKSRDLFAKTAGQ